MAGGHVTWVQLPAARNYPQIDNSRLVIVLRARNLKTP